MFSLSLRLCTASCTSRIFAIPFAVSRMEPNISARSQLSRPSPLSHSGNSTWISRIGNSNKRVAKIALTVFSSIIAQSTGTVGAPYF